MCRSLNSPSLRYARSDTEFCGHAIRRGQMMMGCLGSANSDPAVFEQPERLDLRRRPNRHLAFGTGIHVCLGAKLASVEVAIALERLFTRFPDLRLAVGRSQVRFAGTWGTRHWRRCRYVGSGVSRFAA